MRLLLDTHVVLWQLEGSRTVSPAARAAIEMRPASDPRAARKRDPDVARSILMSRATGTPSRAISTASPASTRASSFERSVLACPTFTNMPASVVGLAKVSQALRPTHPARSPVPESAVGLARCSSIFAARAA